MSISPTTNTPSPLPSVQPATPQPASRTEVENDGDADDGKPGAARIQDPAIGKSLDISA